MTEESKDWVIHILAIILVLRLTVMALLNC